MRDHLIEYATDELKYLVGWGANPARLPLLPTLRDLTDLSECRSESTVGYIIRANLRAAIESLSGSYRFRGRDIPAEAMKRAYLLLLQLDEGTNQSAPNRRQRAIVTLRIFVTLDQWRRPHGAEREFLRILAEVFVDRALPKEQTA